MSEAANIGVRFRASQEVIDQLSDWSKPVQIRIVSWAPDWWELEIRDPFEPATTSGTVAEAVRKAERATNGSIAMMIEAGIQAAMAQRETVPDKSHYGVVEQLQAEGRAKPPRFCHCANGPEDHVWDSLACPPFRDEHHSADGASDMCSQLPGCRPSADGEHSASCEVSIYRDAQHHSADYVAPVDPLRYERSTKQHTDACMEREDGLCDCGAYTGAPLRTVPPRMAMDGDL